MTEITGRDLIKDLAIVLAAVQLSRPPGLAPHMALRRLRKALDLDNPDSPDVVETALRAALDGRPQPSRREIIWRREVQPGLSVLVEDSTNVLLELSTPQGQVLGRSEPLNDEHLRASITLARVAAEQNRDDAEDKRMRDLRNAEWQRNLSAARSGEDASSRTQATVQLAAAGLNVHAANQVLRRAYGRLSAAFNVDGTDQLGTVTYDREAGTYVVRVPEVPALMLSTALRPQVRAALVALGAEFGPPHVDSWIDSALSTAREHGRAELAHPLGTVRAVLTYQDGAYELQRAPDPEQHARHERWQDDTLARLSKDDDQR